MSSRRHQNSRGGGDADFNPIGQNLANSFLQSRHHASEYERPAVRSSSELLEKLNGSPSSVHSSHRNELDVWSGGEYLSTNKLSSMLSDMQVLYTLNIVHVTKGEVFEA